MNPNSFMKNLKVSINIPTYNQEQYILQCVNSVLNQSYVNLEINISDDSNTNKTKEVLKDLLNHPQVNYYKNEPSLGRVKNYNKLLYTYSTGDLALNLDGDDYLSDTNFIKDAVEVFIKNENINLVFGRISVLSEGIETPLYSKYSSKKEDFFILNGFNDYLLNTIDFGTMHLAMLYDRKKACEIGFYNKDMVNTDSDSIYRLCLLGNVGLINRVVGVWRKHEANATQNSNLDEYFNSYEKNESVYLFGKELNLNTKQLLNWKIKEDVNHTIRILGRIIAFKKYDAYQKLINAIKSKNIPVYKLLFSPKFLLGSLWVIFKKPKNIIYLYSLIIK